MRTVVFVVETGLAAARSMVGIRKNVLQPPGDSFRIMLNRQEICEKDQTLGRQAVDSLDAAASLCQRTPGCSRFAYFSISANMEFPANTAFLCSGLSRGVIAAGWVAGAMPDAFGPEGPLPQPNPFLHGVPGPLML